MVVLEDLSKVERSHLISRARFVVHVCSRIISSCDSCISLSLFNYCHVLILAFLPSPYWKRYENFDLGLITFNTRLDLLHPLPNGRFCHQTSHNRYYLFFFLDRPLDNPTELLAQIYYVSRIFVLFGQCSPSRNNYHLLPRPIIYLYFVSVYPIECRQYTPCLHHRRLGCWNSPRHHRRCRLEIMG
jgi:hypothetical protein